MKAPAWTLIVPPNSLLVIVMAVKHPTGARIVKMMKMRMMMMMKRSPQKAPQQRLLLEPRVFLHRYCRTEPVWQDGAMAWAG